MKQRSITLFLTLLLILPVFALTSCNPNEETEKTETTTQAQTTAPTEETTTTNEPMTIDEVTFTMRSWDPVNWDGSPFDQMVQEKFGLKFDIEVIDLESYSEKFKVMFSTGNLTDISTYYKISANEINEAGDSGIFVDYYQYIDIMPNFKALCDKYYDSLVYVTAESGAMYIAPVYLASNDLGFLDKGYGVRSDILDEAGFDYSNLENYDQLYDMFTILKQDNPDQYVIGRHADIKAAGTYMGVAEDPAWWDEENGEWIANYTTQNAKDFVTFWSNAYTDGLLHPDYLSLGKSQFRELFYNGDVTAFCFSFYFLNELEDAAVSESMHADYVLPPLYNGKQYTRPSSPCFNIAMGRLVNSDQDEKVIEKIMKFSDWLYTEEGFLRSIEGEEGVDYIMINEDPAEWVTLNESYADKIPDEYQNLIISVEEIAARRADLPYHLYGFRSIAPIWSVFHNEWHPEQTSKEQLADEKYYESGWYGVPDPVVSLKGDELEEYNNLYATIKDYSDQIIAQMITGQMDIEKEWDTFQENLEIYGYSRLVELYNIGSQNFRSIVPNYQP